MKFIIYSIPSVSEDCSGLTLLLKDKSFLTLEITNVMHLIHFTVTMGKFTKRFSVLFENLLSGKPTSSAFLFESTEPEPFLKVLELLLPRIPEKSVPKDAIQLANSLKLSRDNGYMTGHNFCSELIEYGVCRTPFTCSYRHNLNECDVPAPGMPLTGRIELIIHDIITPVNYLAEILPPVAIKQEVERKKTDLKFSIHSYYMAEENRIPITEYIVGNNAVYEDCGVYWRVRIVSTKIS